MNFLKKLEIWLSKDNKRNFREGIPDNRYFDKNKLLYDNDRVYRISFERFKKLGQVRDIRVRTLLQML